MRETETPQGVSHRPFRTRKNGRPLPRDFFSVRGSTALWAAFRQRFPVVFEKCAFTFLLFGGCRRFYSPSVDKTESATPGSSTACYFCGEAEGRLRRNDKRQRLFAAQPAKRKAPNRHKRRAFTHSVRKKKFFMYRVKNLPSTLANFPPARYNRKKRCINNRSYNCRKRYLFRAANGGVSFHRKVNGGFCRKTRFYR